MSSVTIDSAVEKNKIYSNVPFLFMLKIDVYNPVTKSFVETLYFTSNGENITYQGDEYIAYPFDVDLKKAKGELPTLELTVIDYLQIVTSRLINWSGCVGSEVTFMVVNHDNLDQDPDAKEVLLVTSSSIDNYIVNFKLGIENPLQKRFPRSVQMKDRCRWRYKSTECGYVGGIATCDLTLDGANGCEAHNNTERYGGFPGIRRQLFR